MPAAFTPAFEFRTLDELTIEDESSFEHVGLYADLKSLLQRASYRFRVLPPGSGRRWETAQLINLSFWGADDGGDVLAEPSVPADVVAHVAWHHLAHRELVGEGKATASALFLGEAIASAFDLYLVGRLLGHAPESLFLATQVPALAEVAQTGGLSAEAFENLLGSVAGNPDRAFADLRALLYDTGTALFAARSPGDALTALHGLEGHRFAALLHHYELSNWVLYARAFSQPSAEVDAKVAAVDRGLRQAPVTLGWLAGQWMGRG